MIKQLLVTEKSSLLLENNCYVFLVDKDANKIEIKKFISKKYDVGVKKVNILKKHSKKVRRGRILGSTKSYKKAYVYTVHKIKALQEGG